MSESKNIQYGWVCPLCDKANAPWNKDCSCVSLREATTPYPDPQRLYGPIPSETFPPCDLQRLNGPIRYTYSTYEVTCNG